MPIADSLGMSALIVTSVGVAAASQVLSGMGFALIAGPLLVLALGPADGVRLSVAMSVLLNGGVLARSYRFVRWDDALRLFVPAAVLVLPTLVLTTRLSSALVSAAAGAAVLVGVVLIASGRRVRWVDGPAGAIAAGAGSGILNVLAGTSGPPVALFVAHRGWAARVGTATLQAYALPLNIVTLAALGLPTAQPSRLLWAGLGLILGTGMAWPLADRITTAAVRTIVLTLATVGAVLLLVKAAPEVV